MTEHPEEEAPYVYVTPEFADIGAPVFPIRGDTDECLATLRAAKQHVQECQKLVDTDLNLLADSQAALRAAKNDLAVAVHNLLKSLNVE